jgi:Na+/melibiose symporter-like transporter
VFRGFINDAKSAAGSVIAKYAARASVAVPFIIALGFATAGATLMLVERFGHRNAYFVVAASFTVLGFLAALIVRTKEHEEVVADAQAGKADTADVATDAAAAAAVQMPLALLGALFSGPVGPTALLSLMRVLGRNLPLVLMLVAMGVLFGPKSAEETVADEDATGDAVEPGNRRPNGAYHSGVPQEAA